MRVDAGDAVEELVADRLADDGRAGGEQLLDRRGVRGRGLGVGEPVRIAGAGALARDVVHVLDRDAEARERTARRALERRLQIVRDEEAAHGGVR